MVEVLIAVTITAVLATLLLSITVEVLRVWNRSSGTLMASSQGRVIMEIIRSDLQSAVYRDDGRVWMRAQLADFAEEFPSEVIELPREGGGKPPVEGAFPEASYRSPWGLDPDWIERYGPEGVVLFFFTADPEPSAVAYRLVRQGILPNSPEISYQLVRTVLEPDETQLTPMDYRSESGTELPLFARSLIDAGWNEAVAEEGYSADVLAGNVVDFGVRITRLETDEARFPPLTYDPTIIYPPQADADFGGEAEHFPEEVEVFVRLLTQEGLTLLRNFESRPSPGTWWGIVEANSVVYRERIRIPGR